MIKVIIKFNVNKTLNMDYKPSKEIRNIRKLHTCKNLNLNVLYLLKIIIHVLIFKFPPRNSAKPTLSDK